MNSYNGLFGCDSPVSHYWFGFIVGDGSFYFHRGSGRYRFRVALSSKDHRHVERLAERLGYSAKYVHRRREGRESIFETSDKRLCGDLLDRRLMSNKTYHLTGDIVPVGGFSHFLRGLFDADGSVGFYRYPGRSTPMASWSLFGRLPLLEELKKRLEREIGGLKGCIVVSRMNLEFGSLRFGGRWQVEKIMRFLYRDAEDFLHRKRSVCASITSYNKTHAKGDKQRKYSHYVNGRAVMEVVCARCGTRVWKRIDHVNRRGRYSYGQFCSRRCAMLALNCNKPKEVMT